MRFFSLGYFEARSISAKDLRKMTRAMNIISSREKLEDLGLHAFGSLANKSKRKFLKEWEGSAELPEKKSEIKISSFKDLAPYL